MDFILRELGLLTAADTPVGTVFIKGLSAGQKRRLSIACEAIVQPSLLFLDEPTSGVTRCQFPWDSTGAIRVSSGGETRFNNRNTNSVCVHFVHACCARLLWVHKTTRLKHSC